MNTASSLRHSKTHRAVIKRQWAGQMTRYEFEIPMRGGARLGALDQPTLCSILRLPDGSLVRRQCTSDYGNHYRVVIDVPRGARLLVPRDVVVRELGVAPKIVSGEIMFGKWKQAGLITGSPIPTLDRRIDL